MGSAAQTSAQRNPQAIARGLMGSYGFGGGQWGCLVSLWNGESGWSWSATNPSSGAYGIPQALPGYKMAAVGSDYLTNPVTQIRWGLGYIRSAYGSPCAAWSAWQSRSPHWY
ncbi:Secreted protein (fragment) [Nostocoides japonicum T1-X7]|uniref:Secreted protein n=2 Tax=Nostocoides japonicum T1-X7 TaxID=1194083 RepID=A0A077M2T7_9MICO